MLVKTVAGMEFIERYCAIRFKYCSLPKYFLVIRESTIRLPRSLDEVALLELADKAGD